MKETSLKMIDFSIIDLPWSGKESLEEVDREEEEIAVAYFPLFFNMKGRKILVVGGGAVASRRVESLIPFEAEMTVVAPQISEEIRKREREGCLRVMEMTWQEYEVSGETWIPWMVLAAAEDENVNHQAAEWGRNRGAFVNEAQDRSRSDFYFPGIVKEGNVVVGVTSGGGDHRLAASITGRIRELLRQMLRTDY